MGTEVLSFSMHGAREVMPSEAQHFGRVITALEKAVIENQGLAFDLSKSLIETACKTIIKDRGQDYGGKNDLPQLIKETLRIVCIIPESIDEPLKAKDSLTKTINGLITSIQGICELRRLFGEASHGKDAYFMQLENDHAFMVARSADVIVNYLFRMHRSHPAFSSNKRLLYSALGDFNDWVDDQNDAVKIFKLEYKPSEVLFNIDRVAYRDLLNEFESDEISEENSSDTYAKNECDSEQYLK